MTGYLGAKSASGAYQAIINLMPPHDTYIEAFLGSGAVMQRKAPALRSIGLDRDKSALNAFDSGHPVELLNEDAINWLTFYQPEDRTVIYCDPPYVHSERTSTKRYRYEMTDQDHQALINVLRGLDCFVLLSGYRSSLYEHLLGDWRSVDFQVMSRGGVRTETVWLNYEPGQVHYHTYAGKNFTDRQRIKRKAERWAANYAKLPPAERQAVLAAMLSVE